MNERIDAIVINARQVAELGDLPAVRARGAQYVVVCSTASERYASPHIRNPASDPTRIERYRAFYESLSRETTLVWEAKPAIPMRASQASPEIRIYRVKGADQVNLQVRH